MREADRLASHLAELERSDWALSAYLAGHPDLTSDVRCALRAATRLQASPRPQVSAAFRARSRAHLVTFIQSEALRNSNRKLSLVARVLAILRPLAAPVLGALFLIGAGTGVWTGASAALPESPWYGAKLAFENVEGRLAFTPAQQASLHLGLAATRLQEAQTELGAGNRSAFDRLLRAFDEEVAQAQLVASAAGLGAPELQGYVGGQVAVLEASRDRIIGRVVVVSSNNAVAVAPATRATVSRTPPLQVVAAPPVVSAVQPGVASVVGDPSADGLNRALLEAQGGLRVSTVAPITGSTIGPVVSAQPAAPVVIRSTPRVVASPTPIPAAPVAASPVPALPTPVPTAPIVPTPVPVVPTPVKSGSAPPSGSGPTSPPPVQPTPPPVQPTPPPVQPPPPPPPPVGNPSIPIPIIVHDPTRLPSPALTGHKPVVQPSPSPASA